MVEEAKEKVLQEVIGQQGPPDATVIISTATGADLEDDAVNEIVERFTEVGEVIIVRFVHPVHLLFSCLFLSVSLSCCVSFSVLFVSLPLHFSHFVSFSLCFSLGRMTGIFYVILHEVTYMVHGCMVYTKQRCRDRSSFSWHQPCNNHTVL